MKKGLCNFTGSMKRIVLILLISVYALTTLGVGIREFYCCGKLKSSSLSFVSEAKEKCGMDNAMSGCCKTKFKSLKVKDSHIAADAINNPVKQFSNLPLFTPSFQFITLANEPLTVANASHAPPIHSGVHHYIYYCTYLI
ncbi:MAG: hypothetical protein ABIY51_06575 [Ferruginibacter sp.]